MAGVVSMPSYQGKVGSGIDDGLHQGKIIGVIEAEREGTNKKTGKKETYRYTDIVIRVAGTGAEGEEKELKFSCPTPKETLNSKSKLGKLIELFEPIVDGKNYDPEQILVGKELSFQTTTGDNGYAEILDKSIKKKA